MGKFRGHLEELDRLGYLAWKEAKRLVSTAIGPEEYVLAILHPDAGDSIAARALRDCGITRERLEDLVKRKATREEIEGGPQHNPAAYRLLGLAEGIAAGVGAPEPSAEHVLLGVVWEPDFAGWLEHLGSSREHVRGRLADLGVALPQRDLPPPDPRTWGPNVEVPFDELWILLRELPYVMPHDASLSFNHDWKKGWISATEGVDLDVYIPRALARHRRLHFPPEER